MAGETDTIMTELTERTLDLAIQSQAMAIERALLARHRQGVSFFASGDMGYNPQMEPGNHPSRPRQEIENPNAEAFGQVHRFPGGRW